MRVQEVMSKRVFSVRQSASVRKLWRAIFHRQINAVPVVDARKKLIGLVTKEDLLKPLYPDYREFMGSLASTRDFEEMEEKIHDIAGLRAKEVMNRRVIFTRADTPILRALSRMIARRVHQLPVLDSSDRLVGLITKGDVFYALFKKHIKTPGGRKK